MSEWYSQHNNSISPRVAAWHPADLDSGAIETTVKPIFHYNAKPLALGRRVSLDPQRDLLALDIPTFWFPKRNLSPTNVSQWNIGHVGSPHVGARVCHVRFMFFCVDFICVWSKPTRTQFPVEYGLKTLYGRQGEVHPLGPQTIIRRVL